MEYKFNIIDEHLIIYDKNNKMYVCKNCINKNSKKTKRLLYALTNKHNMSMTIDKTLNNTLNKIELFIHHPLYDDDIYVLYDKNNKSDNIQEQISYIYALELEQNKYYIGKSLNPLSRVKEHVTSTLINNPSYMGSGWTKLYQPNKIIEVINSYDDFDEDKYTLKYMKKYGIDNVRGGSFCELNLSQHNILTIEKMIAGANDKCYYCGQDGHYINNCPQKNIKRVPKKHKSIKLKDITKSKIINFFSAEKLMQNSNINVSNGEFYCKYCNKKFNTKQNKITHETMICSKSDKVKQEAQLDNAINDILNKN